MGERIEQIAVEVRAKNFEARDSLRRYLIVRLEVLRATRSTPARDTEIAELEGWIRWLRGAA